MKNGMLENVVTFMFNFKEKVVGYLYITHEDYGLIRYIGILQFYDAYYYLITSSSRLAMFYEHLATEKSRIHFPLGFVNWAKKSLWIDTCENKICVCAEHSAAGHFPRKVKAGPCSVCWGTACSVQSCAGRAREALLESLSAAT